MKKKNPKDSNKNKKQTQAPNTFVPQNLLPLVREQKPIICPDEKVDQVAEYIPIAEPFEIPNEWEEEKTEEEINQELLPKEYFEREQAKLEAAKAAAKNSNNANKPGGKKDPKSKDTNNKKNKDLSNKEMISIPVSSNNNGETIEEEDPELIVPYYEDPIHEELVNNLPLSFLRITENNFSWLRPKEYITNELLDKNIKKALPKKKYLEVREEVKKLYNLEKEYQEKQKVENIENIENENDEVKKKETENSKSNDNNSNISGLSGVVDKEEDDILKKFFPIIDKRKKITVINSSERDETDEEYQARVTEIIEKQKEKLELFKKNKPKNEKKPVVQKPEEIPRSVIVTNKPSNVDVRPLIEKVNACEDMKEKLETRANLSFMSWISSIFQFIIDLEINDCVTKSSIFSNIYPQKNGTPIYNPNGHYMVKMYFMGKPRRIDIDDRIPCSKDGEFIFPRCENLNELWPAIYTKALLKLNVYKVKHPFYSRNEENVDTNFIYAMTGYHAEMIQGLDREIQIENLLSMNLNDDNFLNKKKYILCLNLFNNRKKDEEDVYYEDVIEEFDKKNKLKNTNNNSKEMSDAQFEKIIEEDNEENEKDSTPLISSESRGQKESSSNKNNNRRKSKFSSKNLDSPSGSKKNQQLGIGGNYHDFGSRKSKKFSVMPVRMKIGNEHFDRDYWGGVNSGSPSGGSSKFQGRKLHKRKTVILSGMKFIDNTLDIISNYAYSINDFFYNGNFNMSRLKPLNFDDLKKKFLEIKVVYKQLNEKEKKEYILKRKDLKEKELKIKRERIDGLKNEGKPFLIVKIKNNSIGQFILNSELLYSEEEIYMAKKCILNGWKYPPPEFFNKFFKKYDLIIEKEEKLKNEYMQMTPEERAKAELDEQPRKKINCFDWTRNDYIDLIDHNLEQFESTEERQIKDPILKTSGGNWMSFPDFISLFNTFLILHNPIALFSASNLCVDNNWLDYKIDCFEPLDDFMVLKLNNEEIEDKDRMYSGFIIFEPNNDKTLASKNKINNYIIIDIVDEKNNVVFKNITMNKFYSTHHVENLAGNMSYYVIIRGGMYQFGFFLRLYCEGHKIQNMTYQNYLTQTLDYQFCTFKIEHPLIDTERFYLLARLHILPANNDEGEKICPEGESLGDLKILFNVKYPIKHLKSFIKIFVQTDERDKFTGKEIFNNEEVFLPEGSYLVSIYFRNLVSPVKENSADIDIVYSNKNYKIEMKDNIDFFEVGDEYIPNRHNIVFKELIYAGDKVFSSFCIELKKKTLETIAASEKEKEAGKGESKSKSVEDKTALLKKRSSLLMKEPAMDINTMYEGLNDKLKLIFLLYQLTDPEDDSIPWVEKKYAHALRGKLIKKFDCFNSLILPCMVFEGGVITPEKKSGGGAKPQPPQNSVGGEASPSSNQQFYPYLLICYLDDSFDVQNSIAAHNLDWSIKIFSTDNLCFIKDISKEEDEKSLKNTWEDKDPGRAEKAKISRKRFMLEKMVKNGETISEEDKQMLMNQRSRKGDKDELTSPGGMKRIGKRKNTKIQINAVNNKKVSHESEEGKKSDDILNNKKILPSPNDHCSGYIKHYLKYAEYKTRTKKINSIYDQHSKVINTEDVHNEKTRCITETIENFNKTTKNEICNTFYGNCEKQANEDMINNFYQIDIDNRNNENGKIRNLIINRNELKCQFKAIRDSKNCITDIIKNHEIYQYDFNYMMLSYNNTIKVLGADNEDEVKLFKIISNKKEEEVKTMIKNFIPRNKNNAIKLIDEVENNKLAVPPEVLNQLKQLVA